MKGFDQFPPLMAAKSSVSSLENRKKSIGRQKIQIKKLMKKSSQQVTFSKRRAGLFNKAAELSLLCGAEIAILAFSSTGKLFTFGHPNVESLLDRFRTANSAPPKPAEAYLPLAELNGDLDRAAAKFEVQKRLAAEAVEAAERLRNSGRFWWDEPIEGMRIEELKGFRSSLLELREKLAERANQLKAVRSRELSMPLALQLPPSFLGGDVVECPLLQLAGKYQCPPELFGDGNPSVAAGTDSFGLGFS